MPVRIGLQNIVTATWKSSMEDAVREYEKEQVDPGQIVFYGPSNFTRWKREKWDHVPLREAILGASGKPCCVNRGFGSSCTEHHLYYYDRMVRVLKPKVLVYAPGYGNAATFGYSKEESWELGQRVLAYALTDFPDIHIYLEGTPANPKATEEILAQRVVYNEWLQKFAEETPNVTYVDKMNRMPNDKSLYVEDLVHYNQKGYDLYAEFYREVLKDELAQF